MRRFNSINEEDDDDLPIMELPVASRLFSVAMNLKNKKKHDSGGDEASPPPNRTEAHMRAKRNWKKALIMLINRGDPWEKFNLQDLPVENAIRHRYNALTKTWKKEDVVIKMERQPFGQGAMRECFRM